MDVEALGSSDAVAATLRAIVADGTVDVALRGHALWDLKRTAPEGIAPLISGILLDPCTPDELLRTALNVGRDTFDASSLATLGLLMDRGVPEKARQELIDAILAVKDSGREELLLRAVVDERFGFRAPYIATDLAKLGSREAPAVILAAYLEAYSTHRGNSGMLGIALGSFPQGTFDDLMRRMLEGVPPEDMKKREEAVTMLEVVGSHLKHDALGLAGKAFLETATTDQGRSQALRLLGRSPSKEAGETILAFLEGSPSARDVAAAFQALGVRPKPLDPRRVGAVLSQQLESKNVHACLEAGLYLAKNRDLASDPALASKCVAMIERVKGSARAVDQSPLADVRFNLAAHAPDPDAAMMAIWSDMRSQPHGQSLALDRLGGRADMSEAAKSFALEILADRSVAISPRVVLATRMARKHYPAIRELVHAALEEAAHIPDLSQLTHLVLNHERDEARAVLERLAKGTQDARKRDFLLGQTKHLPPPAAER